jgi:hypothetical protein
MLLPPLFSAFLLARAWTWAILPVTAAVLGVFLMREPLTVLARQAWVWQDRRPETSAARRSLLASGLVTLLAAAWLLHWIPPAWLLALGAAALAITALAVWCSVKNYQRSALLQLASAAGLTASALAAWLAVRPTLDAVAWWLWASHAAHSAAALLAVRARLEARSRPRLPGRRFPFRLTAALAQAGLFGAAGACVALGRPALAVPLMLSAVLHSFDLWRFRNPDFLSVPLARVGRRELALTLLFSALVIAALW